MERLLSQDEAKRQGKLPGSSFLQDIANQHACQQDPLIIFSTPEIIESCGEALKCLIKKKLLSLVVIDEFDYVDCCHEKFRESCVNLVGWLKSSASHEVSQEEMIQPQQHSSQIPFLFLSATGSSELILEQLGTVPQLKMISPPMLLQTSNIMPKNHVYRG